MTFTQIVTKGGRTVATDKTPPETTRHKEEVAAAKLLAEKQGSRTEQFRERVPARQDIPAPAPKEEVVEDGGFDVKNPRGTMLADLADALADLSDADVKKAQKNDDRAGAEAIYEARLSGE